MFEVTIFEIYAFVVVMAFETYRLPVICTFEVGVFVPIPTRPTESIRKTPPVRFVMDAIAPVPIC